MKRASNVFTRMIQRYFGIRMTMFITILLWEISLGGIVWYLVVQNIGTKDATTFYLILCFLSILGAWLGTRHYYKGVVGNNHVKDLTPDSQIMCQIVMNNQIFMARVKFMNALNAGSCKVRVMEIYHNDMGRVWTIGDR